MYGEWVYAKHTIFYDQLPHYFLEFDLLDKQSGEFLSTRQRDDLLDRAVVVGVPVLYAGTALDDSAIVDLIKHSLYKSRDWRDALRDRCEHESLNIDRAVKETDSSDLMEGLYIKVETEHRVVARYKYIRASFLIAVLDSEGHWLDAVGGDWRRGIVTKVYCLIESEVFPDTAAGVTAAVQQQGHLWVRRHRIRYLSVIMKAIDGGERFS